MKSIGLILAGGSGTRLWPLSRKLVPKQLLTLSGNKSLYQEACIRIKPVVEDQELWVVTNNDIYYQIMQQTKIISREFSNKSCIKVLKEPQAKNTAPAILWAALRCRNIHGSDTNMIVMPSDHVIRNNNNFIEAMRQGIQAASKGFLITFGIIPTYPETGFGYIKTLSAVEGNKNLFTISNFVEKPDYSTAVEYLEDGRYLWNSGMFIFNVETLINEVSKYAPELYKVFSEIDPEDWNEVREAFEKAESISIDYAVMEHTKKALVISADLGWSDVGNWRSVYESSPKDDFENVIIGEHMSIDSQGNYIYSKDRLVVTLGLKGIAIVDTPDALLVTPLEQTHRVREIIESLKAIKSRVHIEHVTVERPWGQYKVLESGNGYKIKKIVVLPHEKISTHLHKHRSEHWIVVKGTAVIKSEDKRFVIKENESTFIPAGMVHTLENESDGILEIIETQSGVYLEEDDIIRVDVL